MLNSLHGTDLIVFTSHHQESNVERTPALMDKIALSKRVFFFLAPKIGMTKKETFFYLKEYQKVTVVQPFLPEDSSTSMVKLLNEFIQNEHIVGLTIWTDTPKALPLIESLNPEVVVYDQTEATFSEKPNQALLERSDLVFDSKMSREFLSYEVFGRGDKKVAIEEKVEEKLPESLLPIAMKSRNQAISRYQSLSF